MTLSSALGMTKEEKLERLYRDLPRESFPVATHIGSSYQPGVFRWDAKHVHFDFLGMGKPQRLTVSRAIVEWVSHEDGSWNPDQFGPSAKDQNVGERTEYIGTAHAVHNSPLWRKKAWNTLNEWCTGHLRRPSIIDIMALTRDCYARLVFDGIVDYFMPDEQMLGPHPVDGALRVYVAQALRTLYVVDEPRWYRSTTATEDQRSYLQVAWDQYVESGGERRAPLRGLR